MGAQFSSEDALVCWGYCPPAPREHDDKISLPETNQIIPQQEQYKTVRNEEKVNTPPKSKIESSKNEISIEKKSNNGEISQKVTVDISMKPASDKKLKTHELRKQVADLEATIAELTRANQASTEALASQQSEVENLRKSMFDLRTDVKEVNKSDDNVKEHKRSVSMERMNKGSTAFDISNGGGGGGGGNGSNEIEVKTNLKQSNQKKETDMSTQQPPVKREFSKKLASGGGIGLSPVKEAPLAQYHHKQNHLKTVAIGTMGVLNMTNVKNDNSTNDKKIDISKYDNVIEPSAPPPEIIEEKSTMNNQKEAERKSPNIAAVLARDHYNATRHRHIENLTAAMEAEDEEVVVVGDEKQLPSNNSTNSENNSPLDNCTRVTVRRSTIGLAESIQDVDDDGGEDNNVDDDDDDGDLTKENSKQPEKSESSAPMVEKEEEEHGAWELVAVRTALSVATSSSKSPSSSNGKRGYSENNTREVTIIEGPIGLTFSSFSILPDKEKDKAEALGGSAGVVVTDVTPSGQASKNNVRLGDLIVSLNGETLPEWVDRDHFLEMLTLADRPLTMGVRSF